jgi:hypothetical protein
MSDENLKQPGSVPSSPPGMRPGDLDGDLMSDEELDRLVPVDQEPEDTEPLAQVIAEAMEAGRRASKKEHSRRSPAELKALLLAFLRDVQDLREAGGPPPTSSEPEAGETRP